LQLNAFQICVVDWTGSSSVQVWYASRCADCSASSRFRKVATKIGLERGSRPNVHRSGIDLLQDSIDNRPFLHGGNMLNSMIHEERVAPIWGSEELTTQAPIFCRVPSARRVQVEAKWPDQAVRRPPSYHFATWCTCGPIRAVTNRGHRQKSLSSVLGKYMRSWDIKRASFLVSSTVGYTAPRPRLLRARFSWCPVTEEFG